MLARMPPADQASYLKNIATQNAMKASAASGSWAPTTGQGLSNMRAGIGTLDSTQGWSNLGSTMGRSGVLAAAAPVVSGIAKSQQQNIPATASANPEYYNTVYDPRTQTYSRGNWSSVYGGPGYTGVAGANQHGNASGPLGSFADPYSAVTAVGNKAGGAIKKLAAGGATNTDDMKQYYMSLMNGSASTSQLTPPSGIANQNFMSQYGMGTAPTRPNGATGDTQSTSPWITSNYKAPASATPPPASTTPTTTAPGIGLPTYGANQYDGVPTYVWNPVTQSYTQTSSGSSPGGGWHGAAGGGTKSMAAGGTTLGGYSDGGRLMKGPGDGMSDSIPAHIVGDKPQPAALADGEFVVPADVVSHLGNGSTDAGSRKLYDMLDRVRRARTGNNKQGKQIDSDKFMPS
jgi:hypothetical protein